MAIWNKVKYSIVLDAIYYKFYQNKEMRNFLFSTGNKILIETRSLNTIWEIHLSEKMKRHIILKLGEVKNLLSFAPVEVRDEKAV